MFENLPGEVLIREVGPRDGLQMEQDFVPTEVKKEFIHLLAASGLRLIEVTSFVNPKWIPALADSGEIGREFGPMEDLRASALVPNMRGLEDAQKAGVREITLFMSATESHNKANLNRTIDQTLAHFAELLPVAKAGGMRVSAALSMSFGCPFEGEVAPGRVVGIVEKLLKLGVDEIGLADTIGAAHPLQVKGLLDKVLELCPAGRIGLHLHDTEGMATANTLTALELGIRLFDGAVGGLGGCPYAPGASGNVPTEQLVYLFESMGLRTGVERGKLLEAALFIQEQLGHPLASNGLRAHLGRRKRAAEAGGGP